MKSKLLKKIQMSNLMVKINELDKIENFVLQSECNEAKEVLTYIMKRN